MTLRVPRLGGDPVLTIPARVSLGEARSFAEAQREWLRRASARQLQPQIPCPGVKLPFEGQELLVTPAMVRSVSVEGDALLIPQAKPAGAVIQAFLKHQALLRLRPAVDHYARMVGQDYRTLVLRDTKSRWGSCSSDRRLMFSWRLIMAPPEILSYVAAHEVAHLQHMDHSERFWDLVARLMPDYQPHRDWLRQHGSGLLAWEFREKSEPN